MQWKSGTQSYSLYINYQGVALDNVDYPEWHYEAKALSFNEKQQDRLLEFFVGEMTARTAADLVGINKTTAAYLFHRLREIIAWQLDEASPLDVNVEADESYFGGEKKGKRGRGDGMPIFYLRPSERVNLSGQGPGPDMKPWRNISPDYFHN